LLNEGNMFLKRIHIKMIVGGLIGLNPDEGTDPDDDPFNGWELAKAVLRRLNQA
jgi:hypothetical protein